MRTEYHYYNDRNPSGTASGASVSDPDRPSWPVLNQLLLQTRGWLQSAVENGRMNDCQALASFAEVAAEFAGSDRDYVATFGALTNVNTASRLARLVGVRSSSGDVRLNQKGQPTGYQMTYQNVANELSTADQAHHFAAFFQVGYLLGGLEGDMLSILYDLTTGNIGDQALGTKAAQLGWKLRSHSIKRSELRSIIETELCQ